MNGSTVSIIASFLGLLLVGPNARAGPVTWSFEGVVTDVYDPMGLIGGKVTIGSPFAGSYTFDPGTLGDGFYPESILRVSGEVDSLSFSGPRGPGSSITVSNDALLGGYDSYGATVPVSFLDDEGAFFLIQVRDTDGALFESNSLPTIPPDLTQVDPNFGGLVLGSEGERFRVGATLVQLVPEPTTLVLLAALLCLRRRCRAYGGREARQPVAGSSNAVRWALPLAVFVSLWAFPSRGADCNRNGIQDASELTGCPGLDIVFLIDTSTSVQGDLDGICREINDPGGAIDQLGSAGLTFNAEIWAIGSNQNCTCCSDIVSNVYGNYANGPPERLSDCNSPQDDDREDWAVAINVVATKKAWTPGAIRVIVPISDEGPRCGDAFEDPGDGRCVIAAITRVVQQQSVAV